MRDTGDLTSEGAIATPAWLQRPGLRAGRGGSGQELQQEVSVGPHLATGHLPQVLRDVAVSHIRKVRSHVRKLEALTALNQAKLGQLGLGLKYYKSRKVCTHTYTYNGTDLFGGSFR